MTTKSRSQPERTKSRSQPEPFFPDLEPLADLLRTPPLTMEERLRHIRALGQRIAGYVRFMSAASHWGGSSAEEKERAVTVFYQQLRAMEQELQRIHESLRLA